MRLYVEIEGDTNDGDYISERTAINEEWIETFTPLIKAIKKNGGYNWPSSEYSDKTLEEIYKKFDRELVNKFSRYVPYGEHGIHTIESIKILEVSKEIRLF